MTKDNGFSDKLKGEVNKAKGELKDHIGNATDNTSLQAEGKFDKAKGAVQEKIGETKDRHTDYK
ncbi:CsbD family protein [Paenisporosarcina sp. FSL H8-0542]|uniref:CsbD family protein n=1 Tax=Paenisporosarcina sp. FSL H8-0542 TaxID=2921401 RepID=UPI00315A0083